MTITDIDPPGAEPVDLAYAKTFLRIDHNHEDSLIADLIRGAREQVETLISGSLISRRRAYTVPVRSGRGLFINHTPVRAVHRVSLIDADGQATDIPLESLTVNLRAVPVSLCLPKGQSWLDYQGAAHIEVDVTAGYGETPEDVPMPLRQAVLLLLAQSYEHRGDGEHPGFPLLVDALTLPFRGLRL